MIQINREYLEKESNIGNIVEQAETVLKKRKLMYERYTRKLDSKDIKVPLEYYIVNIAAGFFGGKAPKYSIKQETNDKKKNIIKKMFDKIVGKDADPEELQILIDYIRDYNDDSSFFYELVKDYLSTNACYGIVYENNDNEIVYSRVPSTQCVALYDYSTPVNKIGLLRTWQETDSNGFEATMVELILDNKKKYYKNSKSSPKCYNEIVDKARDVKWSMLPAIAVENPDELTIFEPVITLIDAYETIIKNNRNIFEYNDDAKLKITGYMPTAPLMIDDGHGKSIPNPERKTEDEALLRSKVFYTPDQSGNIEWIIKNVNDTASENHKKTLIELILMVTCVPNVTDVGFTNADNASALEKKFFPLEQILIQADKQFKKELLYLWELIIDRINKEKNKKYDFREIQIELQRNMPADKKELTEMAMRLRGLLSDESVMSRLPYDLDVESELAKMKKQNEENMQNNLDTMEKLGKKSNDKEELIDKEDNKEKSEE